MNIAAVQQFTMLDYPGKTACIVFFAGCPLRCGYCHNPEFVLPEKIRKLKPSFISEESFFSFLDKRSDLLDGVVISGGEPTVHADLILFIEKIKEKGFLVKLDTNGTHPFVIREMLDKELLDYIAMDVKTSIAGYPKLVGPRLKVGDIMESIDTIKDSNIAYEFRSTLIREVHSKDILDSMARLIAGAKMLYLQQFRSGETLDPKFREYSSFSAEELQDVVAPIFRPFVDKVLVR